MGRGNKSEGPKASVYKLLCSRTLRRPARTEKKGEKKEQKMRAEKQHGEQIMSGLSVNIRTLVFLSAISHVCFKRPETSYLQF